MARSTQAKALGLKRGPLSDATWQQLPAPTLKLLIEIADADRQFGAKPIRARLLDRALRQAQTELSTARSGCATGKAHELCQRKARADEFRACCILPHE